MKPLNILVIHRTSDPSLFRTTNRNIDLCMHQYAPENQYILHNDIYPLPYFIKKINFHAIIMTQSFLSTCVSARIFKKTLKKYDFIRESSAVKIAFPQDDYEKSGLLEKWLLDWHIDLLYTVCPKHWDILYPSLNRLGRLRLGYTGYISEELIERSKETKPFELRAIDVSYRARKVPPVYGSMGNMKGIIGDLFKSFTADQNLKLDISTEQSDTIYGDKWYDFLENSKFTLVSNSGSSLFDPNASIRRKIYEYTSLHPTATFEQVKNACFLEEDGKLNFTAISPRNIEAALLNTVQICVPGDYSEIMKPYEHYIPFMPDGSNINEVLSMMKNKEIVERISFECKKAFLSRPQLRFLNHVHSLLQEIDSGIRDKKISGTGEQEMREYVKRYNQHEAFYEKTILPLRRLTKSLLPNRLKNFLTRCLVIFLF